MMRFKPFVSVLALTFVVMGANAALTLPFSDSFDTSASSSSYIQQTEDLAGASDFNIQFGYDYSSYISTSVGPTSPEISIAEAPNTPGGATAQTGVRISVNDNDDGSEDRVGVSLFPDYVVASGFPLRMTVDVFQMWNGPPDISAAGTTEQISIGAFTDAAQAEWRDATASSGFFLSLTAEGGNGFTEGGNQGDLELYVGTGAGAPTPLGVAGNFEGQGTLWGVFPSPPAQPYTPGSPGRIWVTYELVLSGSNVLLMATPEGGSQGVLYTDSNPASTDTGYLMIGCFDRWSSVAATPADQFVIFDNLNIEEIVQTAVGDFSLYE